MIASSGSRAGGEGGALATSIVTATRAACPRSTVIWFVVAALTCPSIGHAVEPEVASLQRDVLALTTLVQQLQARLSRLEGQASVAEQVQPNTPHLGASATPPASAPGDVASSALAAVPIVTRRLDAGVGDAAPQAQLRINWSKVEQGMSSADVGLLLGEPTRRMALDGRSAWYYSYPALGNGSVFFTAAGRVSSRQSPFAWGW